MLVASFDGLTLPSAMNPYCRTSFVVSLCRKSFRRLRIPAWIALTRSFCEDSRGRWYINVSVEVPQATQAINVRIGIDLGTKTLATRLRVQVESCFGGTFGQPIEVVHVEPFTTRIYRLCLRFVAKIPNEIPPLAP
jgi:hypothetical protein